MATFSSGGPLEALSDSRQSRLSRISQNCSSGSASVPDVKRGMKAPRFSRVELRVQAIASREANNQLLSVPRGRFRKAYEEYPRWQALALWGEAVIGTERRPPSSLLATLKKHCPGFIERRSRSQQSERLETFRIRWSFAARFQITCGCRSSESLGRHSDRHLASAPQLWLVKTGTAYRSPSLPLT